MTATFTQSGANLTITFSYTGTTAKITDIATSAAHQLYKVAHLGDQTIAFDSLSNAAKLAILDTFISQSFANLAKEYYVQTATETARAAAQAAADTNLSLGG